MSSCQFTLPFSVPLEPLVEKARKAVEGQGGTFNGDIHAGSFDVTVMGNHASGSYKAEGNELHIIIDEKPFFVPCSSIENYLRQQLG
jgi:hypothetical protein